MSAEEVIQLEEFISQERQGSYFTLPFHVEPNAEKLEIRYQYARFDLDEIATEGYIATLKPEINIIDIGLIAPNGDQVGASGSDKTSFYVSEVSATPGYKPTEIIPGEWKILVGAYKVEPDGVKAFYDVRITYKKRLWFLAGELLEILFYGDDSGHLTRIEYLPVISNIFYKPLRRELFHPQWLPDKYG